MNRNSDLRCDVLVIGAGPAGIAAAATAAEKNASVILVDDNPMPGGQIWRAKVGETTDRRSAGKTAYRWLHRLEACGADVLPSTRVVARLTERSVLAEDDAKAIEISFRSLILANGARELLLPFPGWTLPNVFAAGGLQALVKSGFPVRGKRIVVVGTGPLLLAVAAFLKSNGAQIVGIYEQTTLSRMARFAASLLTRPCVLKDAAAYVGALAPAPVRCGWWPIAAYGTETVDSITLTNGSRVKLVACDMVACGFHLTPNTELQALFGCELLDGKTVVDTWQQTSVGHVYSVGETTGIGGLDLALVEGQIAALAATGNRELTAQPFLRRRKRLEGIALAMDQAFALRPELRALPQPETVVCRCEDVPWSEIRLYPSSRSIKLHTRCGMGPCQGRVCGAALRFLLEQPGETLRPPVYPVRLATLMRTPQALSPQALSPQALSKEKP